MKKSIIQATAIASLTALSGCQEYLVRSDLVSPYAGNAAAHNASIQTVDPWPRYVYDTDLETSGQRQAVAIKKYHAGPEDENAAPSTPAVVIQNVDPTN